MTSYVAIANGEIDQDSPVTQALMTALRDNPIAITEGDASAPKVESIAVETRRFVFVMPTSGTSFVLSSLDSRLATIRILANAMTATSTASGTYECFFALSNNNGASFGTETKIASTSGVSGGIDLPLPTEIIASIKSGLLWATPAGPLVPGPGVLNIPAGAPVNAIRWRLTGSVAFSSASTARGLLMGVGA